MKHRIEHLINQLITDPYLISHPIPSLFQILGDPEAILCARLLAADEPDAGSGVGPSHPPLPPAVLRVQIEVQCEVLRDKQVGRNAITITAIKL